MSTGSSRTIDFGIWMVVRCAAFTDQALWVLHFQTGAIVLADGTGAIAQAHAWLP